MLTLSKLMIMCQTFVSLSIVAQSGDVHPNPGPRSKYPCGVCSKACKWNQNCIVCDNCETWLHKQCIGINSLIFNQLANSSCTWICNNCGLPQFSSSLFESSLPTSNSFEALADNTDLESEPSSPLMASSPVHTSRSNNRPGRSERRVNSPDSHRGRREQSSVDMEVHGLRLMILNLQGILNETQSFKLLKHNPHIVLATETWLSPEVADSEFLPPSCNYTVFRKDRQSRGGGVLIAVRNDIVASHAPELDVDTELIWIKLQIVNTKPVFIGVFYRQPKLGAAPLKKLHESISRLNAKKKKKKILCDQVQCHGGGGGEKGGTGVSPPPPPTLPAMFIYLFIYFLCVFLAHLSRRLEWAIAVRFRPPSAVRRPSSVNFLHTFSSSSWKRMVGF